MQSTRSSPSIRPSKRLWMLLSAALLTAACSSKKPEPVAPVEVGVVTLQVRPLTIDTDLPGRTAAYRVAEVRPQVGGVILKRLFTEGGEVKAGQPLYQIDSAPFQASLDSALATRARAQATLTSAKLLADRYQPLAEAHAVSRQDYDNAVAAQAQASADVASASAAVEIARINLAYTRVLSPIGGRSGRSSVTEGALVSANQAAALVVVQQLDPIYVDVTQPSALLLRLRSEFASGKLKKVGEDQAQAQLTLEDGSIYPDNGRLQFAEVTVDPGTGSVTLRAVFPNPHAMLMPGMFVHERIEEGVDDHALLVPQQAVSHNAAGEATALVVGADNKVSMRILKTGRAIGDRWLVSAGLADGDKVIAEGLQRVKPGTEVRAHEISLEAPDHAVSGTVPVTGGVEPPDAAGDDKEPRPQM